MVNRMSMKQKDAFSSFWRFYEITPIWKEGICSTMDMQASRLSRRHESLYSANTPKGMYLPATPHATPPRPLSIVFITCSSRRAQRNSESGAVVCESHRLIRPTKSMWELRR